MISIRRILIDLFCNLFCRKINNSQGEGGGGCFVFNAKEVIVKRCIQIYIQMIVFIFGGKVLFDDEQLCGVG